MRRFAILLSSLVAAVAMATSAAPAAAQDATVTVTKDVVPGVSIDDFTFSTTGAGLADFTLDDDGSNQTGGPAGSLTEFSNTRIFTISPAQSGPHSITEERVSGWNNSGASCSEGTSSGRTVSFTVDPGDTITCQYNNELSETDIQVQDFSVVTSTKQAGAHPVADIRMRFCNDGVPIADVTGAGVPVRIRTAVPHGVPANNVPLRVIYVGGNTAANGTKYLSQVVSPTEIALLTLSGQPVIGNGAYTGGGELHSQQSTVPERARFGCSAPVGNSFLRDFTIKLPPGFLGNPTAVTPCPTHLWYAGACPDRSQLGHAFAEAIAGTGSIIEVPTSVFALQTMGLEPARLGTEVVPAVPPGPLVNTVTIRTTGDYGIDSQQINLPKELGGDAGRVRSIQVVLCDRAPCQETDRFQPNSQIPLEPTKPFFVNPTSCGTKNARLEAMSWNPGDSGDGMNAPIEVTGCDNPATPATEGPPFSLDVNVTPDDKKPGASDRQTISLDYDGDYADASIWEAQLKDADTNLPPGMGLAPGGGVGLQTCTPKQFFGVDDPTGQQRNNDPVECPEGSHVGDIEVETPVLPEPIGGKAFFGPTGSPGRPTDANPWKLYLLLEGQGVRIKLVGDVTLAPSGQVRTVFLNNPETPFTHFRLKMGTKQRAVLMNPVACGPQEGNAPLTAYSGARKTSTFSISQEPCNPDTPFQPNIDIAEAHPEQAGAHSVSHIVLSRPDDNDMLTGLKLALPPGAAGSLSGVPKCPLGVAQAGACPASTLVGNIKTTLGSGISLFTVPGKLFLAEPAQPGDVASIVATVPAKAGVPDASGKYPIDLGPDVVIVNRLRLREADTGVDVILQGAYRGGQLISDGIPSMLEGVPLPINKIEITVDREGFFLNPTGCDPRPVGATFTSAGGKTATSSYQTQATGCDKLPFDPTLYMIAGETGKTNAGQDVHPPLTAIVTQKAGEAAISRARVLLPNILRPNVPFLNEPGALCTDAQAQARTCPPKSLVGSARVITPVLPFELAGPVHIVQEIGSILPKLYVYLRGGGFEVLLRARNRITGVRTENTFDFVPDVPQSYFELKIKGGNDGLLNNFYDLCDTPADSDRRRVDYTFNGHNGASRTGKFALRVEGCGSDIAAARISTTRIKVNRKGIAKVKMSCRRKDGRCNGRLALKAKGLSAAKSFKIAKRKAKTLKLKFSKGEVRKLRKAKKKQMKGSATTSVRGFDTKRRTVTLVYKRR
jgi:hypothetical protein